MNFIEIYTIRHGGQNFLGQFNDDCLHDMLNLICFARMVRSTCFRAISAKSDLLDEGLGKGFSHN